MSFRDCILGKVAEGKLENNKAQRLIERFDKRVGAYKSLGSSEAAAMAAADDLLKVEVLRVEQNQRNLRVAALKQENWNLKANAMPGRIESKVSDTLQNAVWRGEGVKKEAYALLNQVTDQLKVNYSGLSRDYKTFADGVRSVLGGETDNANAAKLGSAMTNVFDYLHSRYKQAGGIIGKIDNYFPQVTNKDALLKGKVTKEAWVNKTLPRLDLANMIDEDTGMPFQADKLQEVLGDVYETVMTNGRSKRAKLTKEGKGAAMSGGDIDKRHMDSRFLKFKSPDDFMAHNKEFGVGDEGLVQLFLGHISSMSRDIGILETMGPKPNALFNFMDSKMEAEGTSAGRRKWAQAEYRVLTSNFQPGNIDGMWWKAFTGSQNWLRSAMLGGASISAISDSTFIAATAKVNGLSPVRALGSYLKGLAPGSNETKIIAKRSGFIAESIGGAALGDTRFAGESAAGGITKVLSNMTNQLSGLQHMTKAAQDGISLEGMATIAENIHAAKAWADLEPDLKSGLGRFGFNEKDWADLSKVGVWDQGDAKFVITSELRTTDKIPAKRAKDIADKLDDWTFMLRQMAANEPLLATQAISTGAILGDGAPASPSRYVGATVGLFKSFPVTVMLSHLLPALKRAKVDRNFDHLAMTMIGTTLLGGLAMQMKQLTQGKTPKDMDDHNFWWAAMLQGGGAGLFGDFLFGDYSRFNRNPISEAMGPTVGTLEDIMMATKGNLDKAADSKDTNVTRDLFRVAKRNIPLGNLWYGRLALERGLLDNLERLVDPKFDSRIRKYEKKIKKETGQEFWWRPGESGPR